MNDQDLVEALRREAGLTKQQAGKALDVVVGAMTNALRNRVEVRLQRFGVFKVVVKRGGRVAQGGAGGRSERISRPAPERLTVSLRPSRVLADILRRGEDAPEWGGIRSAPFS